MWAVEAPPPRIAMNEPVQESSAIASDQIYSPRPNERQLTARSVVAGCLLGGVVSCMNILYGFENRLVLWRFPDRRHLGVCTLPGSRAFPLGARVQHHPDLRLCCRHDGIGCGLAGGNPRDGPAWIRDSTARVVSLVSLNSVFGRFLRRALASTNDRGR